MLETYGGHKEKLLYMNTICFSFSSSFPTPSSLLQCPDADPGVQPCHENCVEFSQAPADGKDPLHPRLPRSPQDIKECEWDHLQPDPSPLSLFQLTFAPLLRFFQHSVSV